MKKALVRVNVFVIILSLVLITTVSCSQKKSSNTNQGNTQNVQATETITYRFLKNVSAPENPPDGGRARPVILDFAKKQGVTGVDYVVECVAPKDYDQKLNLLAAGGDLPDYFSISLPTMNKFAQSNMILPLDELVKLMKNTQRFWLQEDLDASKFNGKLFALPGGYRPEPINQPQASGFIVRQDWLDNLGLKQPKTLEEFYNVIKAFTLNDPDKNGKNDTYGLGSEKAGSNESYPAYFTGVYGAYGIMPRFWSERNGELKLGATLPEAKEVLTHLNKWYSEKLIDPEFMLIDAKAKQEKVVNSKIGLYAGGAMGDLNKLGPMYISLLKLVPSAKLMVMEPPKGPKGYQGWVQVEPGVILSSISTKVRNPELLVKFVDSLNAERPEGGPSIVTGEEGLTYKWNKDTNVWTVLLSTEEQRALGYSHPVEFIKIVDRRWVEDSDMRKGLEIANKYVVNNSFWETVQAMRDFPDLSKLWSEYSVKIITGELPISAFDEFVDKWNKQGGKEIEKQVNEAWKKMKK